MCGIRRTQSKGGRKRLLRKISLFPSPLVPEKDTQGSYIDK